MKKLKRIFFAIPLPDSIKKELSSFRYRWLKLPIRWVAPANLHITLLFIGPTSLDDIQEISEIIHQVAKRHKPFFLELGRLSLKKDHKVPTLLWITGEENPSFTQLGEDLEKTLREKKLYFHNPALTRNFIPHITLGRVRQWQWRQMEPEDIPQIEENVSLKIPINKIILMESKLHRQGPEYIPLETAQLEEL